MIDLMCRFKAGPGSEIDFEECRNFIYKLDKERGFKFGKITLDNFQSTDFVQILNKKSYLCEKHSADRESYDTMKGMMYSGRLDYYPSDIVFYELKRLEDPGDPKKTIHHATGASCDIADCIARVSALISEGEVPEEIKERVKVGRIGRSRASRGAIGRRMGVGGRSGGYRSFR